MAMNATQAKNLSKRVKFGTPGGHKLCALCRRVALRDRTLCRRHAGVSSPGPGMAEYRLLQRWRTVALIPPDLAAHPAYASLVSLPARIRCPHRVAMVLAWPTRHEEPMAWHALAEHAYRLATEVAPVARDPGLGLAHWDAMT